MNAEELPEYAVITSALKPILFNLPPKIIAIDGRSGSGKTTLGRYLAWYFQVSLVEADLFLIRNQGKLLYKIDALRHVISSRRDLPVIIESVAVHRLLAEMGLKSDFTIYVSRQDQDNDADAPLAATLSKYDRDFNPKARADLAISVRELSDKSSPAVRT